MKIIKEYEEIFEVMENKVSEKHLQAMQPMKQAQELMKETQDLKEDIKDDRNK